MIRSGYPLAIFDLHLSAGEAVAAPFGFSTSSTLNWYWMWEHWIYRGKKHVLIEADCGGTNGNRCWLWRWSLQQLADEFSLT